MLEGKNPDTSENMLRPNKYDKFYKPFHGNCFWVHLGYPGNYVGIRVNGDTGFEVGPQKLHN